MLTIFRVEIDLYYSHQNTKARFKDAKQACYSSLYQQLGSEWGDLLLSCVSARVKKY